MKETLSRKNKIINRITGVIALITFVVLMIIGIKYFFFTEKYATTDDAQVRMYINPITSRVTGYVKEIKFEENQQVHKGDTLVIIDNTDYQVQVDAAQANTENSQDQISVIDEQVAVAQKELTVSQTQIAAAKAKMDNAQKEYNRYKDLYDLQSATGQQLDNKQTELDVAKAAYQSTLSNVNASKAKISAVQAQKSSVQSEIKRREALTHQNKINLSYTVITAPYDGIMGRRVLQVGQLVQPGITMAHIIDQQSGKWIIANFKETEVTEMKVGEAAEIEIDALPGKKFKGVIESFSAATGAQLSVLPPDNSTGNFVKTAQRVPVKIRFDKNQNLDRIAAGMNAVINIQKIAN